MTRLGPERQLCLISHSTLNERDDFDELAGFVEALDASLSVHVLEDQSNADADLLDLPTLTVSTVALRRLQPRRGKVLQGRALPKSEEYRALASRGIPVPAWVRLLPGENPDLSSLGQHVVTKPDFGAQGAEVRLERAAFATWKPPRTETSLGLGGRFNPRVAQAFIHTGPWPSSYRVMTLLGTALVCLRIDASRERQPLHDQTDPRGQSIVSSGRGCTFQLSSEADVIDLAERAHAALPDAPLLGIDIVRDATSQKLYVVELNSIGYTWLFSSATGLRLQREHNLDLERQMDGRRRAAEVLCRAAREQAR